MMSTSNLANCRIYTGVFLAILGLLASPVASARNFDLFVMAGQSNMVGYRSDATYYPRAPKIDALVPFYWVEPGTGSSNGAWTTLQAQTGLFPSGHFGPEVTFARALHASNRAVAIYKYAAGTTSLARDWLSPGAHGLYDKMVQELGAAVAIETKAGNTLKIKALVWIQGESDAETPAMAKAYEPRLRRIIEEFRTEIAQSSRLPVILSVDEQHPWVKATATIPEAQAKIAADTSCVTVVSMVGLPKADHTHLTPAGTQEQGLRLADAYLKLLKTCPPR